MAQIKCRFSFLSRFLVYLLCLRLFDFEGFYLPHKDKKRGEDEAEMTCARAYNKDEDTKRWIVDG